jgi:hypothetical protein
VAAIGQIIKAFCEPLPIEKCNGNMMITDKNMNDERTRRLDLWKKHLERGKSEDDWMYIQDSGFYGGQPGIYYEESTTKELTSDGSGIALGIMHRDGYDDIERDTGSLIYEHQEKHKPDSDSIKSLQHACKNMMPVFVITKAKPKRWHVQIAWIVECHVSDGLSLICFSRHDGESLGDISDEEEFRLNAERPGKHWIMVYRSLRDRKFKKGLLSFYNNRCVLTGVSIADVLDGAHIRGVAEDGSDDIRNGLLLCANVHRAFDAHLFAIHPETLEITDRTDGELLKELHIDANALIHIRDGGGHVPHRDALDWRWEKTREKWDVLDK